VATLVTAFGELLHVDIIEFKDVTVDGNKYKLIVMDDCISTYVSCPGMKNTSKKSVIAAIKSVISFYNQYRHIIKSVLCDYERVLLSVKVELSELGIKLLDTIPGLHERKLERTIGTLKRKERIMSCDLDFCLLSMLDGELSCAAADLFNQIPNKATIIRTPIEIVTGIKPARHDYVFGQPGHFYHSTQKLQKSMPNGDYGIIVGFSNDARNKYRVFVPPSPLQYLLVCQKLLSDPHLLHLLQLLLILLGNQLSTLMFKLAYLSTPVQYSQIGANPAAAQRSALHAPAPLRVQDHPTASSDAPPASSQEGGYVPTQVSEGVYVNNGEVNQTTNNISTTSTQNITDTNTTPTTTISITTPSTLYTASMLVHRHAYKVSIKQVLLTPQGNNVMQACKEEIDYMINFHVIVMIPEMYENIPHRDRGRIIPSHMFLKWKYTPSGEFIKIKARLVVGGHRQHSETYTDTASPTFNPITVITVLNYMTVENMECSIFDIKA
jgi:hypothetical protein